MTINFHLDDDRNNFDHSVRQVKVNLDIRNNTQNTTYPVYISSPYLVNYDSTTAQSHFPYHNKIQKHLEIT